MRFHSLTVPALALVAVFVPAGTMPRFAPADATTLKKTIVTESHVKAKSETMKIDDEEHEREVEYSVDDESKCVVTDKYVKSKEGRPLHLERTFEELTSESTQSSGDEEDGPIKREQESALTSKTVIFKWDDKKDEYAISFEDDKGDAELLADLDEDLDFRAFLPPNEVKEDATWTVDGSLAKVLMFPGGDLKMKTADDDEDEVERSAKINRSMRENLKGKFTATFKGAREEGEKKLAVIELKGEFKTLGEADSEKQGKTELDVTITLSGELVWDVGGNHVHSVEMQGEDHTTYSMSIEGDDDEGTHHKFRSEIVFTGTTKFSMKVAQ